MPKGERLRNILWMVPFEEEEKHDHYGELAIFFFIYPYRCFVFSSIVCGAIFGIKCLYLLFFIWMLAFVEYLLYVVHSKSPKWQAYEKKEWAKEIRRNKKKQKLEYQKIVELHKDDPPKPVTKRF